MGLEVTVLHIKNSTKCVKISFDLDSSASNDTLYILKNFRLCIIVIEAL